MFRKMSGKIFYFVILYSYKVKKDVENEKRRKEKRWADVRARLPAQKKVLKILVDKGGQLGFSHHARMLSD